MARDTVVEVRHTRGAQVRTEIRPAGRHGPSVCSRQKWVPEDRSSSASRTGTFERGGNPSCFSGFNFSEMGGEGMQNTKNYCGTFVTCPLGQGSVGSDLL